MHRVLPSSMRVDSTYYNALVRQLSVAGRLLEQALEYAEQESDPGPEWRAATEGCVRVIQEFFSTTVSGAEVAEQGDWKLALDSEEEEEEEEEDDEEEQEATFDEDMLAESQPHDQAYCFSCGSRVKPVTFANGDTIRRCINCGRVA